MKKILISTFVLFVFAQCSVYVTTAQTPVAADKMTLIKELLEVMEVKKGAAAMSELMLNLQAGETQNMIAAMIDEDKSLSPEMKAELKKTAEASAERSTARAREFFAKRLNLGDLVEDVAVAVYDKLFTAQEISDLISFYKSPTGRRLTELTPQLSSEMMSMTMAKMTPRLQEFLKEAADAELKILKEAKPDR